MASTRRRTSLCWIACVVALAVPLSGCGSSTSSTSAQSRPSERNQLLAKLDAQLSSGRFPSADLAGCITTHVRGAPLAELRNLAGEVTPDPVTRRLEAQLLGTCLEQGHGVAATRAAVAAAFTRRLPASTPAAYRTCTTNKVKSQSAAALAQLLTEAISDRRAAYAAGRRLGAECVKVPAVFTIMRARFVAGVSRGLQARSLSLAFRNCVLAKAAQISPAQLQQFALGHVDHNLGRGWGRACVASPGAR